MRYHLIVKQFFALFATIVFVVSSGAIPLAAVSTNQGELWHFGLPHRALGQARLFIEPAGNLVVSNIGSSGKDGVSIDPGLAACTVVGFQAQGPFDNGDQIELGSDVFEPIPVAISMEGGLEQCIVPRDELNNGLLRVAVLRDGIVVYQGLMLSQEEIRTPVGEDDIGTFIHWCLIDCGDTRYLMKYGRAPAVPERASYVLPDGTEVEGDGIRIRLLQNNPADLEDSIRLTAASRRDDFELHLTTEQIGQWGNAHTALGEAHMQSEFGGRQGRLTISNIGASGDDGVSLSIKGLPTPDPVGNGTAIDFLVQNIVADGWLKFSTFGVIEGRNHQPISQNFFRGAPKEPWLLIPDYSPIGSSSYTVRLLQAGRVVAEIPGYAGEISVESPPIEFYVRTELPDGSGAVWECWSFSAKSEIWIGADAYQADQIMFFPENADVVPNSVTQVDIRMAEIDQFTILSESSAYLRPLSNSSYVGPGGGR